MAVIVPERVSYASCLCFHLMALSVELKTVRGKESILLVSLDFKHAEGLLESKQYSQCLVDSNHCR